MLMVEIDQNKSMSMRDLDPREDERARPKHNDELQKIHIGVIDEKFKFIGRRLPEAMKAKLMSLLRKKLNFFAWAPEDMPIIDARVICHILAIHPKV